MGGFDTFVSYDPVIFREQMLHALCSTSVNMLLNPTPPRRPISTVRALHQALGAYEGLVTAASYEFRDLPEKERDTYEKAKHVLRLLADLHYPKDDLAEEATW